MKILQVRAAMKVETREKRPSLIVHSPTPTRGLSTTRGDNEENCRGGAAQWGREVTLIIANPTVGLDGCRGRAIYVG